MRSEVDQWYVSMLELAILPAIALETGASRVNTSSGEHS